ncbi:MAG: xanthine dehydrogenase family protein molybdopterin-binding subunit, partial [Gemmatimonadota bacterium]
AAASAAPASDSRDPSGTARAERGTRRLSARYEAPLLAHICMEPVNFTADATGDRVVLHGPTQNPRSLQGIVAQGLGIPVERVEVYPTLAGGGFGRRLAYDYGVEAAFLSRSIGRPVKVVWSREDDIRHDYFRPPSAHALDAVVDADGMPVAWRHHLATGSLLAHIRGPGSEPAPVYDVQGGADMPYAIPSIEFAYSAVPVGVQLGSWRSVAHSFNVFAVESFLDEIAEAGGLDPLELRLRLLPHDGPVSITLPLPGRRGSPAPDHARLRAVLREAARLGGWGAEVPDGVGRGLACCEFKGTYVAHVAEVEAAEPIPRIRRLSVAVDCGRAVNPDGVRAQCEGAAMDAAATVLHWGVELENGRVRQSNFDDHPTLRIDEAPEVDVTILESDREPSGMGEPPYPSAVAAIANAIAAATGRRVRRLPLGDDWSDRA